MKTIQDKDVKFLLKDPRADRPTLIYLVYRFDSGRFKYSTEQTVEPYQWDANAQRVRVAAKPRLERERHETINAQLERHRAALKQVVTALQLAGLSLTNDLIKQHLDQTLQRAKPAQPKKDKTVEKPRRIVHGIYRTVC